MTISLSHFQTKKCVHCINGIKTNISPLPMNIRTVFILVAAIFLTLQIFAQAPQKMSYQAVVRDAGNNLVISTSVGMQISILQGSPGGTAVFVETHNSNTNANGLVTVQIGGGILVSGNFSTINWAGGPYYLKTETDPAGGTSYSITGTTQLLSVPYALYAETSGSGGSGWLLNGNNGTNDPAVPASYGVSTIAGAENWIGSVDGNDLVFGTNTIERLRIRQTSGNIGFGTAAPNYPFHGLGNSASSVQVISNSNASGIGISGQNAAVAGTGTGNGIFGATQQSNGFGLYAANLNAAGTGLIGIGNNTARRVWLCYGQCWIWRVWQIHQCNVFIWSSWVFK
jgi:hypothetical protein